MVRVVVIGYGNPLRRDDGAGWRVAELVAERWGERVTVLTGQQPVPEWAAVLAQADVAFFVDASVHVGRRLRVRRLLPVAPDEPGLGAHALGPQSLLELSRAVYGAAPLTYVLPLPTDSLEFGEGLSPRTARAAQQAVRLLDRRIAALTSPAGGGGSHNPRTRPSDARSGVLAVGSTQATS